MDNSRAPQAHTPLLAPAPSHRVSAPAAECVRIPQSFLEEERQTMGDRWFRQEYCCEFTEADDGIFDSELIKKAVRDDLKPLDFRRW